MHFSRQIHTFAHLYVRKSGLDSFASAFPFTPANNFRFPKNTLLLPNVFLHHVIDLHTYYIQNTCHRTVRTTETVMPHLTLSLFHSLPPLLFLSLFSCALVSACLRLFSEIRLQTMFEKWLTVIWTHLKWRKSSALLPPKGKIISLHPFNHHKKYCLFYSLCRY